MTETPKASPELIEGSASTELASQRTALAFERTALAADRTLMAVVRTSLALIGFGFTIYTFFQKLQEKLALRGMPAEAPRRFGFALIVLGVILLVLGIYNHMQEARERRARRERIFQLRLVHSPEARRTNSSMVIAILLLIVGLLAILSVAARTGPF